MQSITDTNNKIPDYKNYVVKKGDSLYSIAKANNVDVNTLILDNSLNTNVLQIGQVLKIRVNDIDVEECFGEEFVEPIKNTSI